MSISEILGAKQKLQITLSARSFVRLIASSMSAYRSLEHLLHLGYGFDIHRQFC